jgi:hypothetical protein
MTPCGACGAHVRPTDACPVCGAGAGAAVRLRNTAAMALLGLTVACVGTTEGKTSATDTGETETTSTMQSDYGVPSTYTSTPTTGTDTGSIQADYGVPSTGDTGATSSN